MSELTRVQADEQPVMLTVEEAAGVLRIGRSLAYQLATRYLSTGGCDGIPVLRLGGVLRVPTAALNELVNTGHLIQFDHHRPTPAVAPEARSNTGRSSDCAQLSLLQD